MRRESSQNLKPVQPDPEVLDAILAMDQLCDPIDEYEKEMYEEASDHYWDVMLKHLDATQ